VATFAYKQFDEAEKKGFSKYNGDKNWLKDNESEVLFGKSEWFMMNQDIKNLGYVKVSNNCYNWNLEKLKKQKGW
jgi:hypothetical protein